LIGGNGVDYLNAMTCSKAVPETTGSMAEPSWSILKTGMISWSGFTSGSGAFVQFAFIDNSRDQVTVNDTTKGVLASGGSGSILLEGIEILLEGIEEPVCARRLYVQQC